MADVALLAFDDFYARYHRRLVGFVVTVYGPADAEDVAQEAMVRACASYARLDSGRDPWPWLVAIVRNVVRDRRARIDAVPLADLPASVDDATADIEERQLVRAALRRLSPSDRDVLVLRECHDLTFGELSRLLGRSPNTLRQQVFRARRRLADAYTALGGRALGLAGSFARWWREAPAQLAAATVVGTLAGAPAVPAQPVMQREVVAGPATRGGVLDAGPATGRAVPARPLQPVRTARVVVAPTTPGVRPDAAPVRTDTDEPVTAVGADSRTYERRDAKRDEWVVCPLVDVC